MNPLPPIAFPIPYVFNLQPFSKPKKEFQSPVEKPKTKK